MRRTIDLTPGLHSQVQPCTSRVRSLQEASCGSARRLNFSGRGGPSALGIPASEDSMVKDERADAAIREHVGYAVVASAIPVPIADVLAVTAVQLDLVRQLAGMYEAKYDESWGKATVVALTGASAARLGASAIKAVPGFGWLVGATTQAALSGASTWAVGELFKRHFAAGGTPDTFDLTRMRESYRLWVEQGKRFVEAMWRDRESEADASPAERTARTLERLARLRADGALTQEEFERLKAATLAES